MDLTYQVCAVGFWCSVVGVMYAYLGYPAILWITSCLFGRDPSRPTPLEMDLPCIALIIVAHNEADVIQSRIENAFALDYPRDRLRIVIASDGSDDGTNDICRRYADRIALLAFSQRRGKADVLNDAMARLDAEIVVLSDANTFMHSTAVSHLARWFCDPSVGVVCGRLIISDPDSGRNADSIYWRYETFLKGCEARLNALLGANGAIYAIRQKLFPLLPAATAVDDFVIPLLAKLHSRCRIVYDCEAVAHEESAPSLAGEFQRRARIGAGAFKSLGILWPLLNPRYGWTAFAFWSHKVFRWICPLLMFCALVSSVVLFSEPLYRCICLMQLAFYGLCALGALPCLPRQHNRPLRALSLFAAMNLALLVGFFRWLRGTQAAHWQRTNRSTARGRCGVRACEMRAADAPTSFLVP